MKLWHGGKVIAIIFTLKNCFRSLFCLFQSSLSLSLFFGIFRHPFLLLLSYILIKARFRNTGCRSNFFNRILVWEVHFQSSIYLFLSCGFLPPTRPRALAAARPDFVFSDIISRSSCASAHHVVNTNRPIGVVVSIFPLGLQTQFDLPETPRPMPKAALCFGQAFLIHIPQAYLRSGVYLIVG